MKKVVLYCAGFLSGLGIAIAAIVNAEDSVIPYEFKDGQVISADTLNDLFATIKQANQGFTSESELDGAWNCVKYDPTSIASITANTPGANFVADPATGTSKLAQVWTFASSGTTLNTSPGLANLAGGITQNNTGVCANGTADADYTVHVVENALMLAGASGSCSSGQNHVFAIQRLSPYAFRFASDSTVTKCVAVAQPPAIPTELAATANTAGVVLTWVDNGGGATSFDILKKANGVYGSIGTAQAGATSYTDASGASGDLYRIKSVNSNGSSLQSSAALAQ